MAWVCKYKKKVWFNPFSLREVQEGEVSPAGRDHHGSQREGHGSGKEHGSGAAPPESEAERKEFAGRCRSFQDNGGTDEKRSGWWFFLSSSFFLKLI